MTEPCYIDTETRSRNPIAWGTDAYFSCPDARTLLVTWVHGGMQDAGVWDLFESPNPPPELQRILEDHSVPLIAHNAVHDRMALWRTLRIYTPLERWRCTRAQAYAHGFPGALETLCTLAGLPEDESKLKAGHQLIQLFCVPRADGGWSTPHTHPQEWETFKLYAKRDTTALRKVHQWLPSHNFRDSAIALYTLDQRINDRGFKLDAKLAQAAVELLNDAKALQSADLMLQTGGAITAVTQREKLLSYLNAKFGTEIKNLRSATVRELLEHDDLHPELRLLLEMRLEGAKSSGSKYKRGLTTRGRGDRIRYALQFNGAGRTGRWSGKGFQPHNMPRPVMTVEKNGRLENVPVKANYVNEVILPGILSRNAYEPLVYGGPNTACMLALRHTIVADEGNEFVVADWSNIEGRILPWLAGDEDELERFRATDRGEGEDSYKLQFAQMFGTQVGKVNDNERQVGKVTKLAFNYRGGVGALVSMAAGYGMDLAALPPLVLPKAKPEHLRKAEKAWRRAFLNGEDYGLERDVYVACDVLKQAYRETNRKISQCAIDLYSAVMAAIRQPGEAHQVARCTVWCTGTFLIIQLPSGRRLLYAQPRIHAERDADPETGKESLREYITYLTARGKGWVRERAWAGLFIENAVQAIANDVLRHALLEVHRDTLTVPAVRAYLETLHEYERTAIVLHVHDELVLEVPKGTYPLERLIQNMVDMPDWARGLPLAAAGWVGNRYKKG